MIGLDFGINKAKMSKLLRKNIIKKPRLYGKRINKYNGLTNKEEFILEKTCLKKINRNFECLCKKKAHHFPVLKSSIDNKLILSNCGVSLNNYKNSLKNNIINPLIINNKEEQIDCILHNLKKNNIKHLDMCLDGKNLCVSKMGIFSLIDFNIASINNKYKTDQIKKRLNAYGMDNDSYNKNMKNRIIQIIKNTM